MRRMATMAVLAVLFLAWPKVLTSPAQDQPKVPELNETQRLKLDNYLKDYKIADQQVQILKVELAEALRSEQQAHDYFFNYVNELRAQVKAPESEFDFDTNAFRFIPKKKAASSDGSPGGGKNSDASKK